MEYVISLDTMRVIEAGSQKEALAMANKEFSELLQRDEGEYVVVEIWGENSQATLF